MVILKETMKIGPKGQVVIPKIFRQAYNLAPGSEVVFEEREGGILLEKPMLDIVKVAEEAAALARHKGRIDTHRLYHEQIEKRLKRAGIRA